MRILLYLLKTLEEIGGMWMCELKNEYYSIALNDIGFLRYALQTDYYNQISIQCQQIAEKLLKSVLNEVATGCEALLHSHNLRGIYDKIHSIDSNFILNRGDLSILKDIYFDAKYPGDNFVTVTREECEDYLRILNDVIVITNQFRKANSLEFAECDKLELQRLEKLSVFK